MRLLVLLAGVAIFLAGTSDAFWMFKESKQAKAKEAKAKGNEDEDSAEKSDPFSWLQPKKKHKKPTNTNTGRTGHIVLPVHYAPGPGPLPGPLGGASVPVMPAGPPLVPKRPPVPVRPAVRPPAPLPGPPRSDTLFDFAPNASKDKGKGKSKKEKPYRYLYCPEKCTVMDGDDDDE